MQAHTGHVWARLPAPITPTPRWEICVSATDGQFQQVSFVNSICTSKGGTHVDHLVNQISKRAPWRGGRLTSLGGRGQALRLGPGCGAVGPERPACLDDR
jgi:hypothetical protein